MFEEFSLPYLADNAKRVKAALPEVTLPMTVFAKGSHYALEALADTEYDTISLDWTMDPASSRLRVGKNKSLQGNLDPCALYGTPERIEEEVQRMVDGFGTQRYIANLGH